MKIATISIKEELKYEREITIQIPDDMDEEDLNKILDKVERKTDCLGDLSYNLKKENSDFKIIEECDDSMNNPYSSSIELDDMVIKVVENT
jgi:hypothetical protein